MSDEAAAAAFLRLLDLVEVDDGVFESHSSHLNRLYGGQLLAQAIQAAALTGEVGMRVRAIHAHFLGRGDAKEPLRVSVRRIRDGSLLAARAVEIAQDDKPLFVADVSLHLATAGPEYQQPLPVDMPLPDDDHLWSESDWSEFDNRVGVDVREDMDLATEPPLADGVYGSTRRLWARFPGSLGNDPVVHQCGLAYLSDLRHGMALKPALELSPLGATIGATTVDHAMWFHRAARADEWVLLDYRPVSTSFSLGLASSTIHDCRGAQVATAAQEILYRF